MGRVDNFQTCAFFLKGFFLFQTIDRHFSFIPWRKSNGINIFFSSRFRKKNEKKKTQKSNLLEMAIKAKKKSTQSHSLWKLDFPVMDQIKSPQNMSQKQVEYDIPLFHFLTILTIVTFRFIIAKQSYESKKIKKKDRFNCSVIPKNHIRLEIYWRKGSCFKIRCLPTSQRLSYRINQHFKFRTNWNIFHRHSSTSTSWYRC